MGVSQIPIKYFLGLEHQPAPGHPLLYGLGPPLKILLAWAPGTKNSLWQELCLLLLALQILHLWEEIQVSVTRSWRDSNWPIERAVTIPPGYCQVIILRPNCVQLRCQKL